MFSSIRKARRHGHIRHRINARLKQIGLHINAYYLVREGKDLAGLQYGELPAEIKSEILDPKDVPAIAECSEWASLANIQARVDKGHFCVVLKHGEKIAGYTWADLNEVNDATCNYELKPGEAYLYDAFVVPEYRGGALAPLLRIECYKHLQEAGMHTFYSVSDYVDTPAIRFKQKLNAEFLKLYLQIKIGDRELGHWRLKDYS
jgi:ribosomal protein S18 acetylase RimI-like enzyme